MIGSIIWAQALPGTATQSLGPDADAANLLSLALRRWYSSLTLTSPDPVPSLSGLWWWLFGLIALLGVAMLAQRPGRTLLQLVDLPGHVRLLIASAGRLRRSGRMVAVIIGAMVLSWTADQWLTYSRQQGRNDLVLLLKSRSLGELAVEHGSFAALTSTRDPLALGDLLPLLVVAIVLIFQATNDPGLAAAPSPRASAWGTVCWGGGSLYVLYRLAGLVAGMRDFPLGSCLLLEALIVPLLMLVADGTLLAWVLVELRSASHGDTAGEPLDPLEVAGLLPAAALGCLVGLPSRYLFTSAWLLQPLSAGVFGRGSSTDQALVWLIGPGLPAWQGAAVVAVGLIGAAAWTRGTPRAALEVYLRLLRADGGRVVALLIGAGVAAGCLAGIAYLVVLSLPPQSWTLAAADSYAHYATLPVGLLTLAGLVELAERALPVATLAEPETAAEAELHAGA